MARALIPDGGHFHSGDSARVYLDGNSLEGLCIVIADGNGHCVPISIEACLPLIELLKLSVEDALALRDGDDRRT